MIKKNQSCCCELFSQVVVSDHKLPKKNYQKSKRISLACYRLKAYQNSITSLKSNQLRLEIPQCEQKKICTPQSTNQIQTPRNGPINISKLTKTTQSEYSAQDARPCGKFSLKQYCSRQTISIMDYQQERHSTPKIEISIIVPHSIMFAPILEQERRAEELQNIDYKQRTSTFKKMPRSISLEKSCFQIFPRGK